MFSLHCVDRSGAEAVRQRKENLGREFPGHSPDPLRGNDNGRKAKRYDVKIRRRVDRKRENSAILFSFQIVVQCGTALVCSAVGYLCGFLWSMLTPCSWLVHILFLSYVISIAALLLLNAGFGLRASGHACSTTAPAFLLTWKLHPLFVIPSVLLIAAVYRSSLKLSRHTLPQLLAGSAVSLLACVISIVVYGVG